MMDKPFANLRNLIAGEDEKLPRHGTSQPASPENHDDARQAINDIHQRQLQADYQRACGVDDV